MSTIKERSELEVLPIRAQPIIGWIKRRKYAGPILSSGHWHLGEGRLLCGLRIPDGAAIEVLEGRRALEEVDPHWNICRLCSGFMAAAGA